MRPSIRDDIAGVVRVERMYLGKYAPHGTFHIAPRADLLFMLWILQITFQVKQLLIIIHYYLICFFLYRFLFGVYFFLLGGIVKNRGVCPTRRP